MRVVAVADLKPVVRLEDPIYDQTGQILLAAGESLGGERIRIFASCGIRMVFIPEPGEAAENFFTRRGNVPVDVADLQVGTHTTQPLRDQKGVLLLREGAEITHDFLDSFRRRGIRFLYEDQSEEERQGSARTVEGFRAALTVDRRAQIESRLGRLADTPVEFAKGELVADSEELDARGVGRRIEEELSRAGGPGASETDAGQGFDREIKAPPKEVMLAPEVKAAFQESYSGMVRELQKVFKQIREGTPITAGSIGKIVGDVMVMARDIDLYLPLASRPQTDDLLVAHTARVGLFSLAIGLHFRYSRKRIFELAHSALLADIGMLRVPQEIVRKTVRLTDPERAEIRRHVAHGLEMCRSIAGVPWLSACTIHQSHERCDGSGYPERRPGEAIIPAAKIVAVADVYAALSEARPHRPAMLPCRAMEAVIRMGGMNLLDPECVRGLLRHVSIFPVGSWARLSTGERVRVVAANPDDYMRPVVSVVCSRKGAPVDPFRLDLLKHPQIRLRRPLSGEGLETAEDPLKGF